MGQVKHMKNLVIALLILIAAVSVSAQKVKVGSDLSVDVSKYKTYGWEKSMPIGNPIIMSIVVDAIDQALAAKGLKKVETDPELTIAIFTSTSSDLHVTHPRNPNAMGSAISTGYAIGNQRWPITQGMLMVDIADTATKNSVWRASATHTLEHGPTSNAAHNAKTAEKPIRKAVEKMFKQFPRPK